MAASLLAGLAVGGYLGAWAGLALGLFVAAGPQEPLRAWAELGAFVGAGLGLVAVLFGRAGNPSDPDGGVL